MDDSHAVKALAALAQASRLHVFRALVGAGRQGLTPGAITELLALPAATLSFHLKELVQAGLVTQERSGRHLIYRAEFMQMNDLLGYLTAHCCRGESCMEPAAVACKA